MTQSAYTLLSIIVSSAVMECHYAECHVFFIVKLGEFPELSEKKVC
jgi:hypothetical protein